VVEVAGPVVVEVVVYFIALRFQSFPEPLILLLWVAAVQVETATPAAELQAVTVCLAH
jgi:hypothetical protein